MIDKKKIKISHTFEWNTEKIETFVYNQSLSHVIRRSVLQTKLLFQIQFPVQ